MDPEAILQNARDCLDEGDWAGLDAWLADYFEWRLKGGAEPDGGDEEALRLLRFEDKSPTESW